MAMKAVSNAAQWRRKLKGEPEEQKWSPCKTVVEKGRQEGTEMEMLVKGRHSGRNDSLDISFLTFNNLSVF